MYDELKNTNKLRQSTTFILNAKQQKYRLEIIKTLLRDDNINPKQCLEAINKLVSAK